MSKEARLARVKDAAVSYSRTRIESHQQYLGFLEALLDAYDNAPKAEKATQAEIAAVIPIDEYDRGRVAQFIVKARKLCSGPSDTSNKDT